MCGAQVYLPTWHAHGTGSWKLYLLNTEYHCQISVITQMTNTLHMEKNVAFLSEPKTLSTQK